MKLTRMELKNIAKDRIRGNIIFFLVCGLIVGGISLFLSLIYALPMRYQEGMRMIEMINNNRGGFIWMVLSFLVMTPLTFGLYFTLMKIYRNKNDKKFSHLFSCFNSEKLGRIYLVTILLAVFVFLWSLLLVVPGIIKAYSYSQANYLILDEPQLKPMEALHKSSELMYGHKFELFILQLSFFWWMILSSISFGIAMIYVAPYMEMTFLAFYYHLRKEVLGDNTKYINDIVEEGAYHYNG